MRAPVLLVSLFLASTLRAAEIPISQPDVVPIDSRASAATQPRVVAGNGYLVAWSERLWGVYQGLVRVRTYDAGGTPRQVVPIVLHGAHSPFAFWNGAEYVIVRGMTFSKFGSPVAAPAIIASRLRPDGTEVESSEVTLAQSRQTPSIVGIAWNGTRAMLVAGYSGADNSAFAWHLLELDRGGTLLTDTAVDYQPSAVTVRPDGTFFVLRFDLGQHVAAGNDRFAAVGDWPAGALVRILDPEGVEIEKFALATEYSGSGDVAWDGRAWVVLYPDRGALCTARFTSSSDVVRTCQPGVNATSATLTAEGGRVFRAWTSGVQLMTDGGLASTTLSGVGASDAVVDETGLLAAWLETAPDGERIRIGGLANDGTARPEHGVEGVSTQGASRLARAGNQTLMIWNEGTAIKAVRLNASGEPVPPVIELRPGSGYAPVVAARGDEWVVAWTTPAGIESTRLTHNLDATGVEQFGGDASQLDPAIAATKSGYLVAWWESTAQAARIVVEPLDANGRRYAGGNRLVDGFLSLAYPAIGCGPETCLVTWYGATGELWAALLRSDGTRITEDHVFDAYAYVRETVVKALDDGSFLVYRGGAVTPVSAAGVPGVTQVWNAQRITLGDVVTWRGRSTAVYSRSNGVTDQLFAFEFRPRGRAVRR
jgi:hypothetical protein